MPFPTQVRGAQMQSGTVLGAQIGDGSVQRNDLDASTPGSAVIRKAIQGTGIALTSTGGDAGTGDVTISINQASGLVWTATQTITVTDANPSSYINLLILNHDTSSTPAIGLGTGIKFGMETSTTNDVDAAEIVVAWTNVTNGSQSAYMDFQLASAGAASASKMRLFPKGDLSVGSTTDPNAGGVINANTGFRIGNAASSGNFLKGDGTNFVSTAGSALSKTDDTNVTLTLGGSATTSLVNAASLTLGWAGTLAIARGGLGGGTAPSAGQQIRASSATVYAPVTTTITHVTPTAISSLATTATAIMGGMGSAAGGTFTITPKYSGTILILISGRVLQSTASQYATFSIRYGTGTAPAKGAAVTGTATGNTAYSTNTATANIQSTVTLQAIVTGLTVNTAYWIDLAIGSSAATNTTFDNADAIAIEL